MICKNAFFQEKCRGVFSLHPVIPDSVHLEPGEITPSNSGYVGYVGDNNRIRNMGQVGDFMRNHLMGYGWDMNNWQQMGHEWDNAECG